MNANIKKVDELMKNRNIKFSVACKAYKLIRRGMSVDAALVIANAREGKELLKQQQKDNGMKKSKCEKSLEQLIDGLEDRAYAAIWENNNPGAWEVWFEVTWPMRPSEDDALNYVSTEASRKLNAPRIGKDALDLCYSNTDGAEVLF